MGENYMRISLRLLPSVDEVLRDARVTKMLEDHPRIVVLQAVRAVLADERRRILSGAVKAQQDIKKKYLNIVVEKAAAAVKCSVQPNLRRIINATGVILHTNLGRALLSERAREAVSIVASNYSNLELSILKPGAGDQDTPRWKACLPR